MEFTSDAYQFGYVSLCIQGTSHNMVGAYVQMFIMHRVAMS